MRDGTLAGKRRGLKIDPELLYTGAMFHDMGLTRQHSSANERFEVDIQAFYDGIKHKPETTFGNVNADVLADKDPAFRRGNFGSVIRGSAWPGPRGSNAQARPYVK
jgi:HD superfamily phosphodiesterase